MGGPGHINVVLFIYIYKAPCSDCKQNEHLVLKYLLFTDCRPDFMNTKFVARS